MRFPWFRRIGFLFVPVTIAGWLLFVAGLGYAVVVFRDVDSRSHSVSDTMINFVFQLLLIGAVYSTVAFFTSRKRGA
jgi:hypothetical protein